MRVIRHAEGQINEEGMAFQNLTSKHFKLWLTGERCIKYPLDDYGAGYFTKVTVDDFFSLRHLRTTVLRPGAPTFLTKAD